MNFENNLKSRNSSKTGRTFSAWLYELRYLLLALVVILLIFIGMFLVFKRMSDMDIDLSGGMDGCLITRSDAPILATVWVDGISRSTYQDGCFFFAVLTPGEHQFQVQVDEGTVVYTRIVEISSGQAIDLGTIQIGD